MLKNLKSLRPSVLTSFRRFSQTLEHLQKEHFEKILKAAKEETSRHAETLHLRTQSKFNQNKDFLQRELKTNPFFLKCFPNLASTLEDATMGSIDQEQIIADTTVVKKGEQSFFEDLKKSHTNLNEVGKNYDDRVEDNNDKFQEAFFSKNGPKYRLTAKQKQFINDKIDLEMEQLEQTGLSREEILFNRAEGVPLAEDKFFQFIKLNRTAREMLINEHEEFSVETVVNLALHQNIGPDLSTNNDERSLHTSDNLRNNYKQIDDENKMFLSKKNSFMFRSEELNYEDNLRDKLRKELNAQRDFLTRNCSGNVQPNALHSFYAEEKVYAQVS